MNATAPAAVSASLQTFPLDLLVEHPDNPRRHFDLEKLQELAASIAANGLLNPLLVRPERKDGKRMQILAGARRYRAAKMAGLAEVPVLLRDLDDAAALELMVTDNQQRQDVHPLEEAQGYHLLHTRAKYDVARIAEKVGLSVKYVYDRMKLLSLTKEAQQLFLDGRFTAGHAVILARLKPEDQKRALDEGSRDYTGRRGGLWQDERVLFHPEDRGGDEFLKPVSVRELQAWVDEHTKLEAAEVDPMLFPDTAATVKAATDEREKVVRITHEQMTPEELKGKGAAPVILGRSWKRADGQRKSKTCDRSVIGMIVIGPGRGEALRVCTDKKRCTVHWGDLIRAAKKREREVTKTAAATGEDREAVRRKKEAEDEAKRKAEGARWEKAKPTMAAAVAAAVRKAGAGASGAAGQILVKALEDDVLFRQDEPLQKVVPSGKSAEDLVRHLAFRIVARELAGGFTDQWERDALVEAVKPLGIDVKKIVDQAAPPEKPEPKKAAAKPAKKAGRARASA